MAIGLHRVGDLVTDTVRPRGRSRGYRPVEHIKPVIMNGPSSRQGAPGSEMLVRY
jgi:hypothetical protein